MNSPKVLLFDLGGVLIENTTFEHLTRLLPENTAHQGLKERWLASPSVRQFERGQSSTGTFANSFVSEWNLKMSPDEFLQEFTHWPRSFFPGAKQLLQTLRQRYRVGCLSNSNPLHWARFEEELTNLLDVVLCSHQLGAVKPDQDIYLRALQACDAQPRDIYFFDDCLANVNAAHGLDINGFCVNGFTSLKHILLIHGLLLRSELSEPC